MVCFPAPPLSDAFGMISYSMIIFIVFVISAK